MRRVIEELCTLLSEEKRQLEGMCELSQEKRRAIIKGDSEALEAKVRQEVRELSRIKATEKKRMALMPEISKLPGLHSDDLTISAIAQVALPDEKLQLIELQKELSDLLQRQSKLNEENQELIRTHIEYSNAMLDLMVDTEDPLNNFYGGDGRASDSKRAKGFFDGQA